VLSVLGAGPQVLVQDAGRVGYGHLGVPRAGALDAPAAALGNRLVGNPAGAAVLEALLGGLVLRTDAGCWVAVTGALVEVSVDGVARGHGRAEWLPAGSVLRLGVPRTGLRCYVAVAGGIDVDPVLGSRSTDTLAWVGPPPVTVGDVVPVGAARGVPAGVEAPLPRRLGPLRLLPGPRPELVDLGALTRTRWEVLPASNRIGLRLSALAGPAGPVSRAGGEVPSEGTVLGAVQVPPDGQPVVLLADRGPTGGYPVAAVVHPDDLWQCAQLRPGESVSFRLSAVPVGRG
jgi:biotin-dependent carboxylase-like uncharacterized protein